METKKGYAHWPPHLAEENHAHHSQGWWHEEGTTHTHAHGSVLGLPSTCCPLSQLLWGLASNTAALRTTQLEMQQGRAGISPLPRHHCVFLHGCMGRLAIHEAHVRVGGCLFCAHGCVRAHVGYAVCTCWCCHMAGYTCVCTCMSQGRDVSAPQRDLLRISLLQAVSFLVKNNLFTQSWAHVELMLSAHVYDKTVDLSELSPTNRWGNWSTRTSHRAAALVPCS